MGPGYSLGGLFAESVAGKPGGLRNLCLGCLLDVAGALSSLLPDRCRSRLGCSPLWLPGWSCVFLAFGLVSIQPMGIAGGSPNAVDVLRFLASALVRAISAATCPRSGVFAAVQPLARCSCLLLSSGLQTFCFSVATFVA